MSRRRRRSRARKGDDNGRPSVRAETVELMVSEIEVDEEWNCRDVTGSGAPGVAGAESPAQELSLEELELSVREHGLLQSLLVRRLPHEAGEGRRWGLVAGFRRHEVCVRIDEHFVVPCTVLRSTGDAQRDELLASVANLAENLHRRDLRPFEIANTLHRISEANDELTQAELAELVGFSRPYCRNLLSVRRRACPELWTVFVRHGTRYGNGITFVDLLDVVKLDKEKQIAAWAELVDERTSFKPFTRDRISKRLSRRQIKECLRHVGQVDGEEQYRRGIRQGLLIALGETTLHKHKDAGTNGSANREVRS